MQTTSFKQLFDQLSNENLVNPAHESDWQTTLSQSDEQADTPWYVKAMVGASAWLAAFMLGSFFGVAGLIDSSESMSGRCYWFGNRVSASF